MPTITASKKERTTSGETALGRLFVLDLSGDRIFTVNPDGSNKTVIVTGCRFPDGIVVDAEN
jgi:hypothetical protein